MMTLIAAAVAAAAQPPALPPANPQAQHMQHHQQGQPGQHKMDGCECCKNMAKKEHGERAGHDMSHGNRTSGN